MSAYERFRWWFVSPLEQLEKTSAEGAFVAFMISFSLFERFIKSKLHSEGRNGKEFYDEAAKVLGIDKVLFVDFWEMYRVGIMHFLQPKISKKDGLVLSWEIDASFGELPVYFLDMKKKMWFIRISPWKWAKLTIHLWDSRKDLLEQLQSFPIGQTRIVIGDETA